MWDTLTSHHFVFYGRWGSTLSPPHHITLCFYCLQSPNRPCCQPVIKPILLNCATVDLYVHNVLKIVTNVLWQASRHWGDVFDLLVQNPPNTQLTLTRNKNSYFWHLGLMNDCWWSKSASHMWRCATVLSFHGPAVIHLVLRTSFVTTPAELNLAPQRRDISGFQPRRLQALPVWDGAEHSLHSHSNLPENRLRTGRSIAERPQLSISPPLRSQHISASAPELPAARTTCGQVHPPIMLHLEISQSCKINWM